MTCIITHLLTEANMFLNQWWTFAARLTVNTRHICLRSTLRHLINVAWLLIRTGFDREIPGFRRYRLVGNESLDEYHLEIVNSTLEDEAVFQCQVTPAGGDAPLLGIAHLTVTGTSYLIVTGTSYLTVTGTSYLTVTGMSTSTSDFSCVWQPLDQSR